MKRHLAHRSLSTVLATAALAFSACTDGQSGLTSPDTAPSFGKAPPGWNGSVTSTLADGFSYASDGAGSYQNGVSSVESIIQDVGSWVLSTQNTKSTRRMRLSFAAVDSGTVPFTGSQLVRGRFISKNLTTGARYQDMKNGDVGQAPLAFAFEYGGKNYRLAMNPENALGVGTDVTGASCIAALSATDPTCKTWQLVPTGANGMNVSRLILVGTNSETPVAMVRVNFQITFSR